MIGKQSFSKNNFNFFPKNIEKNQNIERIARYILIALLASSLCFSAYTFVLYSQIQGINSIKEMNLKRIDDAKPLVQLDANIKKANQELDKILAFLKSVNSVEAPMVTILNDLEAVTPSDVTINSFTLDEDAKITINGMSKNEYIASEFVASLKSVDKLSNVYLKSISKKLDDKNNTNGYVNLFVVECQVKDVVKVETKKNSTSKTTPKASPTPSPGKNGGKK